MSQFQYQSVARAMLADYAESAPVIDYLGTSEVVNEFEVLSEPLLAPCDIFPWAIGPVAVTVTPPVPLPTANSTRVPLVDRAPDAQSIDPRIRRSLDQIQERLNALHRRGHLVAVGVKDYIIPGVPVNATRAPAATDDVTTGVVPGTIWVDTDANDVYVNLDAAEDAAVWLGPLS